MTVDKYKLFLNLDIKFNREMSELKRFFYPSSFEDLLTIKMTTINQEKDLDFVQRKNNMERDALKEEKLRY